MSAEGRAERTAAPAGRRSVPPTVVQRTTASIARSPAQALQDRLGFRATQQLIARSPAARVGTTALTSAQTSKARRLPISSPRDPAEIEAEAVARRVVTMQAPPSAGRTAARCPDGGRRRRRAPRASQVVER
jgi:tRNA A37 threonylcarbamoyladenosine synthetase subunit TsaC/SUA5/YrdC